MLMRGGPVGAWATPRSQGKRVQYNRPVPRPGHLSPGGAPGFIHLNARAYSQGGGWSRLGIISGVSFPEPTRFGNRRPAK